jgi:hypothetical protein
LRFYHSDAFLIIFSNFSDPCSAIDLSFSLSMT